MIQKQNQAEHTALSDAGTLVYVDQAERKNGRSGQNQQNPDNRNPPQCGANPFSGKEVNCIDAP